jgi:hypothetical protein
LQRRFARFPRILLLRSRRNPGGRRGTVLAGDTSTERREERVAGKAGDSPWESHRALRRDSPRFPHAHLSPRWRTGPPFHRRPLPIRHCPTGAAEAKSDARYQIADLRTEEAEGRKLEAQVWARRRCECPVLQARGLLDKDLFHTTIDPHKRSICVESKKRRNRA